MLSSSGQQGHQSFGWRSSLGEAGLEYVLVAGTAEVSEGFLLPVEANGIKLFLTKVEGAYYAAQRKCPHLGFNLCRGRIEDHAVVCPLRQARFDLVTGQVMREARLPAIGLPATPDLQTYPVQVNGYDVLIGV
jgi:nitrite reductase/ring-hydroxylating ferredoxin subunit